VDKKIQVALWICWRIATPQKTMKKQHDSRTIAVFLTAVFEVATALIDTDDTFSSIRHADSNVYWCKESRTE
jgi:hypothetical protein